MREIKMRKIKEIVVHCSATREDKDYDVNDIRAWHKARGWSDVGYHYVIRLDGTVEQGRAIEKMGAHVKGHNKHSIGICLIGGIGEDGKPCANYTHEQYRALRSLISELKSKYHAASVLGHRDFKGVHKACPCFDVRHWLDADEIKDGDKVYGSRKETTSSPRPFSFFKMLLRLFK